MRPVMNVAKLRRPLGLAARAVLFTTGLLLLTAFVAAATVLVGAEQESERHQLAVAQRSHGAVRREHPQRLIADGDAQRAAAHGRR